MTQTPRKLVAGNWKMHGVSATLQEAKALAASLRAEPVLCRVALFPPSPLIHRMVEAIAGGVVEVGAQDCHPEPKGAYTGDASAEMLHDAGARLVILGHSERRFGHRESDRHVAEKVEAALRAGLEPLVCVGETREQHRSGATLRVVDAQLKASLPDSLEGQAFSIAYEPVWAIGAGETPSMSEIEAVHACIRETLAERFSNGPGVPILYGGSVKSSNAAEILNARHVCGALVGGASLTAADFLPIVRAA